MLITSTNINSSYTTRHLRSLRCGEYTTNRLFLSRTYAFIISCDWSWLLLTAILERLHEITVMLLYWWGWNLSVSIVVCTGWRFLRAFWFSLLIGGYSQGGLGLGLSWEWWLRTQLIYAQIRLSSLWSVISVNIKIATFYSLLSHKLLPTHLETRWYLITNLRTIISYITDFTLSIIDHTYCCWYVWWIQLWLVAIE